MRLKFILNGSGKTLNGSRLMAFDDRSVSDGSFLTEEQGLSTEEPPVPHRGKRTFNTSGAKVGQINSLYHNYKDM